MFQNNMSVALSEALRGVTYELLYGCLGWIVIEGYYVHIFYRLVTMIHRSIQNRQCGYIGRASAQCVECWQFTSRPLHTKDVDIVLVWMQYSSPWMALIIMRTKLGVIWMRLQIWFSNSPTYQPTLGGEFELYITLLLIQK